MRRFLRNIISWCELFCSFTGSCRLVAPGNYFQVLSIVIRYRPRCRLVVDIKVESFGKGANS